MVTLYTSRALVEELSSLLNRKKLSKQVTATGLTAAQVIGNYKRVAALVIARQLIPQVARDPDDDAVLACALAARADLVVSGDKDLLVLKAFRGIPIVTVAQVIKAIAVPGK